MARSQKEYFFKVVLIGDSGVGKTSLINRFTDDCFLSDDYMPCVGIEFKMREIEIDGKSVRLQICDTAGQETYRAIIAAYYRNVDGVVVVYDITNPESYQNVRRWFDEIEEYSSEGVYKIMVGNKADLESKRAIQYTQAKSLADELGVPFLETSAKTSTNVEQLFVTMASDIKARVDKLDSNNRLKHVGNANTKIPKSEPTGRDKSTCC